MTAKLISGKDLSGEIREEIKDEVEKLKAKGIEPHITVILIGDNPASLSYVRGKEKAAQALGMSSEVLRMEESTSEEELITLVKELNENEKVHGILVQLPLPDHIDEQVVVETIDPNKDVDGFHPVNVGRMMLGQDTLLPCTPFGVMKMLEWKGIEVEGKNAVIVGSSNIVGKPMGQLLLREEATVTNCHIKTRDLKEHTRLADILVVAAGVPHLIKDEHVKEGAVVIDVGINRLEDGSLTGDVDFEKVKDKVSYITPVPGGVGPMTITMLLYNTVQACKALEQVEA